jgi:hypothetical protein
MKRFANRSNRFAIGFPDEIEEENESKTIGEAVDAGNGRCRGRRHKIPESEGDQETRADLEAFARNIRSGKSDLYGARCQVDEKAARFDGRSELPNEANLNPVGKIGTLLDVSRIAPADRILTGRRILLRCHTKSVS